MLFPSSLTGASMVLLILLCSIYICLQNSGDVPERPIVPESPINSQILVGFSVSGDRVISKLIQVCGAEMLFKMCKLLNIKIKNYIFAKENIKLNILAPFRLSVNFNFEVWFDEFFIFIYEEKTILLSLSVLYEI